MSCAGPIKQQFRMHVEIGNLGAEEAHTYFVDHVLPTFPRHPPCDEHTWPAVHRVCGGNPGLLLHCVAVAAAVGDWEHSLQSLVRDAWLDISRGLSPSTWEGAAWGAGDCRTVLTMIAKSRHATVSVSQLEAALCLSVFGWRVLSLGGSNKLQCMNKMKLLLRRSYDPLARDIDPAAFGPRPKDVYTLPSAAHLCAARLELELE